MSEPTSESVIAHGIEWFQVQLGDRREEDCQCARCGSSCSFVRCGNCDEGLVEHDFGDGIVPDVDYVECDWCRGTGGSWHCISDPAWCEAHPLAGREEIASTALNREAWNDA